MICCFKGKFKVTSPRGIRIDPITKKENVTHKGIDLVGIDDINVYAIADGVIAATPYESNGFGYYVRQLLPDGRRIYYAHLKQNSITVKPNQSIKKGQKLGVMGKTGRSTGAHTHLEIRPAGTSGESLDISAFTGIPNKVGTYTYIKKIDPIEAACNIEDKCGFEKQTMEYLWKYKYANDLMVKLWKAME